MRKCQSLSKYMHSNCMHACMQKHKHEYNMYTIDRKGAMCRLLPATLTAPGSEHYGSCLLVQLALLFCLRKEGQIDS